MMSLPSNHQRVDWLVEGGNSALALAAFAAASSLTKELHKHLPLILHPLFTTLSADQ